MSHRSHWSFRAACPSRLGLAACGCGPRGRRALPWGSLLPAPGGQAPSRTILSKNASGARYYAWVPLFAGHLRAPLVRSSEPTCRRRASRLPRPTRRTLQSPQRPKHFVLRWPPPSSPAAGFRDVPRRWHRHAACASSGRPRGESRRPASFSASGSRASLPAAASTWCGAVYWLWACDGGTRSTDCLRARSYKGRRAAAARGWRGPAGHLLPSQVLKERSEPAGPVACAT